MILCGFYNPLMDMLGFCLPIFRDAETDNLFVQEIEDDIICDFQSCSIPIHQIAMLKSAIEGNVNDDAIYGIKINEDDDIHRNFLYGDRNHVSDVLRQKVAAGELDLYPYTIRNIGYFVGDEKIVRQVEKQIKEIEKEFFARRPKPFNDEDIPELIHRRVADSPLTFDKLKIQTQRSIARLDISDILIPS